MAAGIAISRARARGRKSARRARFWGLGGLFCSPTLGRVLAGSGRETGERRERERRAGEEARILCGRQREYSQTPLGRRVKFFLSVSYYEKGV